jgi:pyruvate kinase
MAQALPRQTKIIATLGPASESEPMLEALFRAGVDVVRLNMAHADEAWVRAVTAKVRAVGERLGRPVAVMMDVKGPEIRTGARTEPLPLSIGQVVDVTGPEAVAAAGIELIPTNYAPLIGALRVGSLVLVDNGLIQLRVTTVLADRLRCSVEQPGSLGSRRHINLPGVKVDLPPLTDKDRRDVALGCTVGVDLFALSFVREASDVAALRALLQQHGSRAGIIAKIEDQSAVEQLGPIITESDGLMVARGDLGIEIPYETLPLVQRRAIALCQVARKPVIVATHMLESMITNPVPTRAEVSDIANAVTESTDALMLSGETTTGKHPLKCVEVMSRIAAAVERDRPPTMTPEPATDTPKAKLLRAAANLAMDLGSAGIVVFTRNGDLPRVLASMRAAGCPIHAFAEEAVIARRMRLLWGVEPHVLPFREGADGTIEAALALLRDRGYCLPGELMVIVTNVILGEGIIDSIQLRGVPTLPASR